MPLTLSSPLFEVAPLQRLDYYQAQAKQNYPAIVQAHLKKELTEQNIKAQQAAYLPDVALILEKNTFGQRTFPLQNLIIG